MKFTVHLPKNSTTEQANKIRDRLKEYFEGSVDVSVLRDNPDGLSVEMDEMKFVDENAFFREFEDILREAKVI